MMRNKKEIETAGYKPQPQWCKKAQCLHKCTIIHQALFQDLLRINWFYMAHKIYTTIPIYVYG